MKYAVFASGGKQYKVQEGSVLELEKINAEEGAVLTFDTVLLHAEDGIFTIGQPHVPHVTITAKVLGQLKGEKIRVAKFKAKARYRKVYGHRQMLTKVQIESIGAKSKSSKQEKKITKVSPKIKVQSSKLKVAV